MLNTVFGGTVEKATHGFSLREQTLTAAHGYVCYADRNAVRFSKSNDRVVRFATKAANTFGGPLSFAGAPHGTFEFSIPDIQTKELDCCRYPGVRVKPVVGALMAKFC